MVSLNNIYKIYLGCFSFALIEEYDALRTKLIVIAGIILMRNYTSDIIKKNWYVCMLGGALGGISRTYNGPEFADNIYKSVCSGLLLEISLLGLYRLITTPQLGPDEFQEVRTNNLETLFSPQVRFKTNTPRTRDSSYRCRKA